MMIQCYSYTDIGNRPENEDSHACISTPQGVTAVVADGLGGQGGGKLASQLAAQMLSGQTFPGELPTPEELTEGFQSVNQAIFLRKDGPNRMMTTAVYLRIQGDQAVWAHVGDSRLYHFFNGQLAEVTLDHSITQLAVTHGMITRQQMPGHPDRSRLTRALGSDYFQPMVHEAVTLPPGDHAFLLCTDGFWEALQEDEIFLDLNKSATAQQWVEFLRLRGELRRETMKHIDNNTAVAVWVHF